MHVRSRYCREYIYPEYGYAQTEGPYGIQHVFLCDCNEYPALPTASELETEIEYSIPLDTDCHYSESLEKLLDKLPP